MGLVIMTLWYWGWIEIDQWNRIENFEIDLPKYVQFLTKEQKQFKEVGIAFSINDIGATEYA